MEAISLDSKTLLIKSDDERDLADVIEFISQKGKKENISAFLKFASERRKENMAFRFVRNECYDRFFLRKY